MWNELNNKTINQLWKKYKRDRVPKNRMIALIAEKMKIDKKEIKSRLNWTLNKLPKGIRTNCNWTIKEHNLLLKLNDLNYDLRLSSILLKRSRGSVLRRIVDEWREDKSFMINDKLQRAAFIENKYRNMQVINHNSWYNDYWESMDEELTKTIIHDRANENYMIKYGLTRIDLELRNYTSNRSSNIPIKKEKKEKTVLGMATNYIENKEINNSNIINNNETHNMNIDEAINNIISILIDRHKKKESKLNELIKTLKEIGDE